MTVELFFEHSYLRDCKTQVTNIHPYGLEFEHSVFFPTQDGFPGDSGQIYNHQGEAFNIIGTILNRDTSCPVHILETGKHTFKLGDPVTTVLDWQRRYQHMQMHSCLHLLCFIVGGKPLSKNINGMVGKINIEIDSKISISEIEEKLATMCKKNLWIKTYAVKLSKIEEEHCFVQQSNTKDFGEFVRVMEIEGLGHHACKALHVRSTKEISLMMIRKVEKSSRNCRRISLEFSSTTSYKQKRTAQDPMYSA